MKIAGIVANSTVDYPQTLSAVIFTGGCNMNCFFCHNKKLITNDFESIAENKVWEFLKKRQGLLDGIVISGGEPTIQPDLIEFIRKVKILEYKVKLDTNGNKPEVIEKLLEDNLLNYVAVDYKAPWARYYEFCKCAGENLQKTLQILKNASINWEARTTMLPHLTKAEYITMAQEIFELPRYVLNPYRIPNAFEKDNRSQIEKEPYPPSFLKEIAKEVKRFQPNTELCDFN
ncbi:MAG: anaerobic ribonucleoside-triphosphate reductase activating protein [Oscillospiraceae bacterium]|jgi:pyruvate formate lyase activating enzyme|nr:anaerobic ribonucleoside-triphosphate reductase activating protein [Oscillospiraceae bacterium]